MGKKRDARERESKKQGKSERGQMGIKRTEKARVGGETSQIKEAVTVNS